MAIVRRNKRLWRNFFYITTDNIINAVIYFTYIPLRYINRLHKNDTTKKHPHSTFRNTFDFIYYIFSYYFPDSKLYLGANKISLDECEFVH